MAHTYDLRAEVGDELAGKVRDDWRAAPLDALTHALLDFAEKVTSSPARTTSADLDTLRASGLADEAIHDAAQVIAYFNYINRLADCLGVEPETWLQS